MNPMGTITKTADGGYVLHYERVIAQPPERVWAAITDSAFTKNWLGETEAELRVGGKFIIRFVNYGGGVMTGVIQKIEIGRLIEYSWSETYGLPVSLVRWTVTPDGSGARLTLTHTLPPGHKPEDVISFGGGWHGFLDALDYAARGEDGNKIAIDQEKWPQMEALYKALFEKTGA